MKKLAVGITTYNNVENIDTIERIYNISEIDVYIVDDSSTDGLREALEERKISFETPPYKIGAPGYARNMILDHVIENGNSFVTFLDGDDDVIDKNLIDLTNTLDSKYSMYYTPMMTIGYNDALIPLASSNYEFVGVKKKTELLLEEEFLLRKRTLMGSGGRVYNVDLINKHQLRYDDDKSGQDTLFNHTIFQYSDLIYFNDVTKPFYIYDIQMDSLSNNYKLNVLERRLILISEVSKFPYTIHTKMEYMEKAFERYTDSYLMPEEEKVKLSKVATDFTGEQFSYVKKNDYLIRNEQTPSFTDGVNIILINTELEISQKPEFNIIKINKWSEFEGIKKQLKYSKTVFFNKTTLAVNEQFILDSIKVDEDMIQPLYVANNTLNIHHLQNPIYHGFTVSGFSHTYTYIGTIYSTKALFTFNFNSESSYEYLIKIMFFNCIVPKVYNTTGFVRRAQAITKPYKNKMFDYYNKCYFSNTKAKISLFNRLALAPIQKGSFIGRALSYDSQNLTYEDQSFVETQLEEFKDFEGAYFIDESNQIIETTSQSDRINFSKMICGKKIKGGQNCLNEKKLVNIPKKYKISGYNIIALKNFNLIYKSDEQEFVTESYIAFDYDVHIVGQNKEYIKFVDENDEVIELTDSILPRGEYRLYFNQSNIDYINKLKKIEFNIFKLLDDKKGE